MKPIRRFSGDYAFLSNFFERTFEWGGDRWPTAEHAFQAAKAAEPIEYFKIRDASSPGKAKRIGRHCLLREDWEKVKLKTMEEIVTAKFLDWELREKLLATGNAELIEGNTWGDRYWGVDLNSDEGQNHLGKILMKVRSFYTFGSKRTCDCLEDLHEVTCIDYIE